MPKTRLTPENQLARAVARMACEPANHMQSAEALSASLGLPPEIKVHFVGPTTVRFDGPEYDPRYVANALGLETPVVHLHWNTYHAEWSLGSNPTTGELDRFAPAIVRIRVTAPPGSFEAPGEPTLPLPAGLKMSSVDVQIPDGVVAAPTYADVAIKELVAAMDALASHPDQLKDGPDDVAKRLGLAGERFRLARVSTSAGKVTTNGISVQPQRARISARALADALGLKNARAKNVGREHGVWEMSVDGDTNIRWRGIQLGIRVSPKDASGSDAALDAADVSFVTMLP